MNIYLNKSAFIEKTIGAVVARRSYKDHCIFMAHRNADVVGSTPTWSICCFAFAFRNSRGP